MTESFDCGNTCKSVSYLQMDRRRFQILVLDYIKDNVPEFSTCCPEGWDFDEYRSMDALMSYLLGDMLIPGSNPYIFFVKENESLSLNDPQLSVDGQTWMLKITIDECSPEYNEKVVEVPIPYSLLQNIKNELFKNHKLVKVC